MCQLNVGKAVWLTLHSLELVVGFAVLISAAHSGLRQLHDRSVHNMQVSCRSRPQTALHSGFCMLLECSLARCHRVPQVAQTLCLLPKMGEASFVLTVSGPGLFDVKLMSSTLCTGLCVSVTCVFTSPCLHSFCTHSKRDL